MTLFGCQVQGSAAIIVWDIDWDIDRCIVGQQQGDGCRVTIQCRPVQGGTTIEVWCVHISAPLQQQLEDRWMTLFGCQVQGGAAILVYCLDRCIPI